MAFKLATLVLTSLALTTACKKESRPEFHTVDRIAAQEKAQENRRKAILSLPYLGSSAIENADANKRGVTKHDPQRVVRGLTVFCNEGSGDLLFLNLDGDVVHRINSPAKKCSFGLPFGSDFLIIGNGNLYNDEKVATEG
jgi:hypothetical protein